MAKEPWKSPSIPWAACTPDQRRLLEEIYRNGDLSWKLTKSQLDSYKKLQAWRELKDAGRFYGLDISRRWGKSALESCCALEDGFRNKNWRIVYIAPTYEMVTKIVLPLIDMLLVDCPPTLRPKYIKSEKRFQFHTGSHIDLIGLDIRPDGARGTGVDMVYFDEAGFFDNLEYLITSVIQPQMLGRKHARIIAASTPPTTPLHYWSTEYIPAVINIGSHDLKVLDDADQYSDEEIEEFYANMPGGRNGVAARREYRAEHIADSTLVILPEFREAEANIVREFKPPVWRDCYVSMDPGYHDMTGILYGYWDFYERKLVIEDEGAAPRLNSWEVAKEIQRTEKKLWKGLFRRGGQGVEDIKPQPYLRVADGSEPRLLADLSADYQLSFIATQRDNLIQQVDSLRVAIQRGDLVIHPRCRKLIKQCKHGIWKKGRIGKDFARVEETNGRTTGEFGHFDLIAALVYLWRNVHKNRTPEPKAQRFVAGDLLVRGSKESNPNSKWYRKGGRFYINTGKFIK